MEVLHFPWILQEATTFQLSLSTHVPLSASELSLSTAMGLSIRWRPYPLILYPLMLYPLMLSSWSLIRWSIHPLMDVIRWRFWDIRWRFVSYPLKLVTYQLIPFHLYKITRHEIFTINLPICISTGSQHDSWFSTTSKNYSLNTKTKMCYCTRLISK